MKVIGRVEPTQNELLEIEKENSYRGGNIVILSRHEMGALKMLQEACDGLGSDLFRTGKGKVNNTMMDNLFMLVYRFAEAKFAINDFKLALEGLESILEDKNK